ncbi:DUF2891 domain-containing protein [Kordiimonas marina]|uniref:DUF2891 domain-containing protein n=1 Tax=Kordiimonas marina TaxID=2872312 RepID=UPI0031B9BFCD
MTQLTPDFASTFVRLTIGHLTREYPNKLDHVMAGPADVQSPSALHPIFYGSFDWHSCVHGWWQIMRLLRTYPDLPEAGAIRDLADKMLVPEKVAGECAYLEQPSSRGFERTYGWAWLLALHHELSRHEDTRWATALEPLARMFAARFHDFLPKLTYPIRHGIHSNTAFAFTLVLDWAHAHDKPLAALMADRAMAWFEKDRAAQAWEPSGDEFLSPTLMEAMLMSRLMDAPAFAQWFAAFLPDITDGYPECLLTPATVSDRTDGKIAHLDGLNLSRAWCWRGLGAKLTGNASLQALSAEASERHLAAALPHLAGDYMGEHWLATFALLALQGL